MLTIEDALEWLKAQEGEEAEILLEHISEEAAYIRTLHHMESQYKQKIREQQATIKQLTA